MKIMHFIKQRINIKYLVLKKLAHSYVNPYVKSLER